MSIFPWLFLSLFLINSQALTQETNFHNFQLKGELLQSFQTIHSSDSLNKSALKAVQRKILQGLDQKNSLNSHKKSLSQNTLQALQGDNQEEQENMNPVLKMVNEYFQKNFIQIKEDQAEKFSLINKSYNLGIHNFSGIKWQKPFGGIYVDLRRNIAPDLLSEDWIINDQLTFHIDAKTYLGHLNESGLIDITQNQLLAFAGLTFQRVYHYTHKVSQNHSISQSYFENLDKLFFSFNRFHSQGFLHLQPEERIARSDSLNLYAGAGGHIPLYHGLSFQGAFLAEKKSIKTLAIARDNQSFFMDYQNSSESQIHFKAGIEGDFLKIIYLTLFSLDYSRIHQKSTKVSYKIDNQDLPLVAGAIENFIDQPLSSTSKELRPFVSTQSFSQKYDSHLGATALFWDFEREQSLEHIEIVKDHTEKKFLKFKATQNKVSKSIFETLINGVTKSLVGKELLSNMRAFERESVTLEYTHINEQSLDINKAYVEQSSDLKIVFSKKIFVNNLAKRMNQNYFLKILRLMDRMSTLHVSAYKLLAQKKVKENIEFNAHIELSSEALDYFNSSHRDYIAFVVQDICQNYAQMKKRSQLQSQCQKKFMKHYTQYSRTLSQQAIIQLKYLKDFLFDLHTYGTQLRDFTRLFGFNSTSLYGSIQGENGQEQFLNYFKGQTLPLAGPIELFAQN